jgi:hypothetical protein
MNAAILYHFAAKAEPTCKCAYCRRNGRSIKSSIKHAANRAARKQSLDLSADGLHIVRGVVQNDVDTFKVAPDLDLFDSHVDLYESRIEKYDYFDYWGEAESEQVPCSCCGEYR